MVSNKKIEHILLKNKAEIKAEIEDLQRHGTKTICNIMPFFFETLLKNSFINTLPQKITLDTSELVRRGAYTRASDAKSAAKTFFKAVGTIYFEWEESGIIEFQGKHRKYKAIFHDFIIKKYIDIENTSFFELELNPIPTSIYFGQFTYYPLFYYKLTTPAQRLLAWLCSQARTNNTNSFTRSHKAALKKAKQEKMLSKKLIAITTHII